MPYLFAMNAMIVVVFVILVAKKYHTILNPVGFFAGYYAVASSIAPFVYWRLGLLDSYSKEAVGVTAILSGLYFAALGIAFLIRRSPVTFVFDRLFRLLRPIALPAKVSGIAEAGMISQFLGLFIILMITSGAGLLWITNSRDAYQFHRDSVGVWWSLSQATLMLSFICVLFRSGRSLKSVALLTIIFATAALFLGSKASTLAYFVIGLFYTQAKIRTLKNRTVILAGSLLLAAALALQIYQGTAADFVSSFLYFDYFKNSASLLDRITEFKLRYGAVMLSNIWYYVPRGLYHAKPYGYGQMVVAEFLFPGAAQDSGFTPGLMNWTAGYADFGIIGAILSGFFTGFVAKGAYEYFLQCKNSESLALFSQFGLIYYIELFPNAPFAVFLLWFVMQMIAIRLLSVYRLFPFRFVWLRSRRRHVIGQGQCLPN